ncbi:MAG: GWxTD domain-containing protein, partial [Bacteroidales bacterium]|nr:GWxTD domain-containing protein [Bacteroidales bacterium]
GLSLLTACFMQQRAHSNVVKPTNKGSNFASLYNPSASVINPQISTFITSSNSAICFFRLSTREVKNAIANPEESKIELVIKYFVRDAADFQLLDSSVMHFNFGLQNEYMSGQFPIRLAQNKRQKVVVDFSNSKYKIHKRLLADIKNTEEFNDDKCLIRTSRNEPVFSNVFPKGQSLRIIVQNADSVKIEYYKTGKFVSLPPYLSAPNQTLQAPDSIFNYVFGTDLHLRESGFYAIGSTKKNEKFGVVASENSNFPAISNISDMVEPLALIATQKEMDAIYSASNLKQAVDAFWLGLSKSEKSAKEQIRVFYNRVALANLMFSSNTEGWKTDRGMIYIMLGPPTIVNISPNSEEWTYGDELNGAFFTFENYSGIKNDFLLHRSNSYQAVWSQVLKTWRSGKVFTITKQTNE